VDAASLMVRYLEAAGVQHLFGYPGTPNLPIIQAAYERGFTLVTPRREGTAAFMAQAYGMLTGLPGACFSTLGPGSTSLVNGVANATLDRAPMMAISGQASTRREPYWTHQVVDHARLFAPVTKWSTRLVPESTGPMMRKALRVAVAERPGAVHITTAGDLLEKEAGDRIVIPPLAPLAAAPVVSAAPGVSADPIRRLSKSRRPAVVVGAGAVRAGATRALVSFAEEVGCPVVVAPAAKGVFPEDHPCFAGTFDMACGPTVWNLLDSADLLLLVAFDAAELIRDWEPSAPAIHIDSVPNTDQVVPAEIEVVGSISDTLRALAEGFTGEPRWSDSELTVHREKISDVFYQGLHAGKLNPSEVSDVIDSVCPRGTYVSTDIGSHKLLIGQGWHGAQPGTFLMSNGLSSMGFSLPAAMTAKLLHPDACVVCTTGDGGLGMVTGELAVAAEHGLGVIVVVFTDGALHRIRLKQEMRGLQPQMTGVPLTDHVALAESMACDGARVETAAEMRRVMEEAVKGLDRPLVIEAHIDPSQYESQF